MLREASVRVIPSTCLTCVRHGRSYLQGHCKEIASLRRCSSATKTTPGEAEHLDTDPHEKEYVVKDIVHESVDDSIRQRLNVTLGETSKLLTASYKIGEKTATPRKCQSTLQWTSAVQQFDNHFAEDDGAIVIPDLIEDVGARVAEKGKGKKRESKFLCYSDKAFESANRYTHPDRKRKEKNLDSYRERLKIANSNHFLRLYTELCINRGKPDKARSWINILLATQENFESLQLGFDVINKEAPNLLMQAYADSGLIEEAMSLFQAMKAVGTSIDSVTYIWLLSAAVKNDNPKSYTDKILAEVKEQHLSLTSAIHHPEFVAHRKKMIQLYQSMKSLYPDLDWEPHTDTSAIREYNNELARASNINHPYIARNPHLGCIPLEQAERLVDEHFDVEVASRVEVPAIKPSQECSEKTLEARKTLASLRDLWHRNLMENYKLTMKSSSLAMDMDKSKRSTNMPDELLRCLPAEEIVSMLMVEVDSLCDLSAFYSQPLPIMMGGLAQKLFNRYQTYTRHHKAPKIKEVHLSFMKEFVGREELDRNTRVLYEELDTDNLVGSTISTLASGQMVYSEEPRLIGELLLDIILKSITLPQDIINPDSSGGKADVHNSQAFFKLTRRVHGSHRSFYALKPHPELCQLMEVADKDYISLSVEEVPTFIPPVPWRSMSNGVLLNGGAFLVRQTAMFEGNCNYFGEPNTADLLPVLDAANVLSGVPWTVNSRLLENIIQVFDSGGNEKLKIAVAPDSVEPSEEEKSNLGHDVKKIASLTTKLQSEAFAEKMSLRIGLSISNYVKGRVFWLPATLDFRGRAYSLSPHLTTLNSDPRRSLLRFANGKALGTRGLEWLKIHLVNLSGLKKRESNAARLAYAEELLPHAFQSAATPLEGEQWWKSLDSDNWQALAACMELKAAYDSGDPTSYVSHLPIHQDGSCNGLQHYAALGLDVLGAAAVNVLPDDSPHDTYSEVAERVDERRVRDAAAGHGTAIALQGQITRKVVKQTVMTVVYGVTKYGAVKQVSKHLSAQCPDVPQEVIAEHARYIAENVLGVVATMFHSSTEIKNWLTLLTDQIVKIADKPITWKTPLGFPVTQNYWSPTTSADRRLIKQNQEEGPRRDYRHDNTQMKPNLSRQRNGVAPNFIHSLDATHMMLTALKCDRMGLTFAAIHDCFWTHACDIDIMNKNCRESFHELYQQPILNDFSQHLIDNYTDDKHLRDTFLRQILKTIPKRGDLDISKVRESEYFFS